MKILMMIQYGEYVASKLGMTWIFQRLDNPTGLRRDP